VNVNFLCSECKWQDAVRSLVLYRSSSHLISFGMRTSLCISIRSANIQKHWVLHWVMFHMQSAYLLVDSSSKSIVFFYSPLSDRLGEFCCKSLPLLTCWHLLWKEFLYTFHSDYPDTSLNQHYLKKRSSPDKRVLNVLSGARELSCLFRVVLGMVSIMHI